MALKMQVDRYHKNCLACIAKNLYHVYSVSQEQKVLPV